MTTYVVDTSDHPVCKESEGSWEGTPSGHSGRPYHRQHRTHRAPGRQRVGTRSEVVEDGHHQGRPEVEWPQLVSGLALQELRHGWLERPEQQQHAHVPRQPCAETLPPSCGPSIPFGSP